MGIRTWLAMLVSASGWLGVGPYRVWGQSNEPAGWHSLFEKCEFTNPTQEKLLYRLLRPDSIEPGKTYPLVLFLHGAGERGDDNTAQLVHGLREFVRPDRRRAYPAFVVVPQCPLDCKWVEVPWDGLEHSLPEESSPNLRLCHELLEKLSGELPVDRDRVYLTGLSMGGFGTFDAISRWPERFAAAVPICGGGDPRPEVVSRFRSLPLWAFHGDQDQLVPPDRTRRMVAALQEAGGQPRYTEYPGVGHDSWTPAYADDALFEWLFQQRRKKN